MLTEEILHTSAAASPVPAENAARAVEIDKELDDIVNRSGRGSRSRRVLRRIGNFLADRLDRLVAQTAPLDGNELPPQIRFPFF
jgi:hypothetical protein